MWWIFGLIFGACIVAWLMALARQQSQGVQTTQLAGTTAVPVSTRSRRRLDWLGANKETMEVFGWVIFGIIILTVIGAAGQISSLLSLRGLLITLAIAFLIVGYTTIKRLRWPGWILAGICLWAIGATPVKEWRDQPSAPVVAYHDPYEWELVMYKNGEVTGPRCKTRIISESSTRLGLEYDYDRGKGRIRLQSSDGGQNWQGTWETSAGTGNVLLKMNPEKDSLRGRWWNSDSQKKEDREGGPLHIMKQ